MVGELLTRDTSHARPPRWTPTERVAVGVATVGGVGFVPGAPGTVASTLTAIALWLVPSSRGTVLLALVAVVMVGTIASHVAERALGGQDPGAIVVDEVAGVLVSVLLDPSSALILAIGVLLFRLFDIAKPFPVDAAQRLPGGLGVMADDLVAGLYALGLLGVTRGVFAWP
jgi:phosphatidylglycerophosphatase A